MLIYSRWLPMKRIDGMCFGLSCVTMVLAALLSGVAALAQVDPAPAAPQDTAAADSIPAGAVTPLGLSDTIVARGQTVRQTEVHALLPYIFFERDSAIIPSRYVRIEPRDLRTFSEERIERGNTLNVYYQLLNVIGSRLRVNRRATITVTGYRGMFEPDSTLGLRRAEAVRDYLRDVWRIREDRIQVAGEALPPNPSLSEVDTVEGDFENQRVEFQSNDLAMLAPVRLPDTLLLQPAGVIRLLPPPPDRPDSVTALESWQVNLRIGDSVVPRAVAGYGPPPQQIDIPLEERPDLARHGPVEITSELVILDSLFEQRRELQGTPVWFVEEGRYQVERNVEDGYYVDRYNLLLYSFDSAGIFNFSQQAAGVLRERIQPQSAVTIIGHTDRIGLPPYNLNLSRRRAETAAGVLGLADAEIVARGESDLLYDNEVPEGRYLCRTVTVVIETPIYAAGPPPELSSAPAESREPAASSQRDTAQATPATWLPDTTNPPSDAASRMSEPERQRTDVPTSVTLPAPE